ARRSSCAYGPAPRRSVLVTLPIACQLLGRRLDQVLLGHTRQVCDPLKNDLHMDDGERARSVQRATHDQWIARQGTNLEPGNLRCFCQVEYFKQRTGVRASGEAAGNSFRVGGVDRRFEVGKPNSSVPCASLRGAIELW